jgi:hypothetical protein
VDQSCEIKVERHVKFPAWRENSEEIVAPFARRRRARSGTERPARLIEHLSRSEIASASIDALKTKPQVHFR